MRMNEVVTQFIDKHLVTGIDRAARNHLTLAIGVTGINLEILTKNLRRSVNFETLSGAFDPRKREKKEKLLLGDVLDHVLVIRNDINVVASADHEIDYLFEKV